MSRRFFALALALGVALGAPASVHAAPADEPSPPERAIEASPESVRARVEADAALPPLPPEYSSTDGPGFSIAYHPSARERVERLVPEIGAARAELEWQLGRALVGDVRIRIAGLDIELPHLAGVDLDDAAAVTARGGLLVAGARLIVLSAGPALDGEPRDLAVSLRDQLARLALGEALRRDPGDPRASVASPPDWFVDAYATQFARGSELGRSSTLLAAAVRGDLPHLGAIGDASADAVSRAFAAEAARALAETDSGRGMQRWVAAMRDGEAFDSALAIATASDLDAQVRDRIGGRLAWVIVASTGALLGLGVATTAWLRRSRRRRARAIARALVRTPALELIDPILGAPEEDLASGILVRPPSPTRVHHDGAWHTVH